MLAFFQKGNPRGFILLTVAIETTHTEREWSKKFKWQFVEPEKDFKTCLLKLQGIS